MMRDSAFAAWGTLCVLMVSIVAAWLLDQPPRALPEDAALDSFAAGRAYRHVQVVAAAAHPTGSATQRAARDYIAAQLRALGLRPQIQATVGIVKKYGSAGTVENILARIPGARGGTSAIALVAHYDSVPAGPGASDDGAGVATLLETARALLHSNPLGNDIVLLFTDGEEAGLLGAAAFVAEHPWARNVALALNFEARGSRGPVWLFETSANNGELIRQVARSAPDPVGSSMTYEVYRRIPNDTDMTLFKAAGTAALNFAFVAGWEHYHTALDRPENLDLRSLQHHGSYALALARQFGSMDLSQLAAPDAIYFTVPGGLLLHYPQSLAFIFGVLITLVYIALIYRAARKGMLIKRQLALAMAVTLGSLVLACAAAFGYAALITWLHRSLIGSGNVIYSELYCGSLVFLAIAIAAGAQTLLHSSRCRIATALGQLGIWLALLWLSTIYVRGASYLFLVPLSCGLVATAALLEFHRRAALAIVWLLALPTVFLLAPLGHALFALFGMTSTGAICVAAVIALSLPALVAQWTFVVASKPPVVPLAAVAVSAVFACIAVFTVRYSPEHPRRSVQMYIADVDEHRALWASSAGSVDNWNVQFLGKAPRRQSVPQLRAMNGATRLLAADAPSVDLPAPEITLIEDEVQGDQRVLGVHIKSLRQARCLTIYLPQARVLASSVAGRNFQDAALAPGQWRMTYTNVPVAGIDVQLRVAGTATIKLVVLDRSEGLPTISGHPYRERPPDSISHDGGDVTLVHRSFSF